MNDFFTLIESWTTIILDSRALRTMRSIKALLRPEKLMIWCPMHESKIMSIYFYESSVTDYNWKITLLFSDPSGVQVPPQCRFFQRNVAKPNYSVPVRNDLDQKLENFEIGKSDPTV